MNDYRHEFARLNTKLDAMDMKLDDHLKRISKAETNIVWLKASLKSMWGTGIMAILGLLGWLGSKTFK